MEDVVGLAQVLAGLIPGVVVLAALARGWVLHRRLAKFDLVRVERRLGLSLELRRKAAMSRASERVPMHPAETRVQALRLVGLPLMRRTSSVALPPQTCGRLAALSPRESDYLFHGGFRLGGRPVAR